MLLLHSKPSNVFPFYSDYTVKGCGCWGLGKAGLTISCLMDMEFQFGKEKKSWRRMAMMVTQ